jgi:hypothetical protein
MKIFSFVAWALFLSANAHAWTNIINCQSGQVAIDRNENGGFASYQIVFRDRKVVDELRQTGAVEQYRINSQGEAILPLQINSNNRSEFVGEDDAFSVDGRVYYVKPQRNAVEVEVFQTSQPTGGIYTVQKRIGVWKIDSCLRDPGL